MTADDKEATNFFDYFDKLRFVYSGTKRIGNRAIAQGMPGYLAEDVYVCPKCLKRFDDKDDSRANYLHTNNCQTIFSETVFRQLILLIVKVTATSPINEQQICERMSEISRIEQQRSSPMLREGEWTTKERQLEVFLLIKGEEAVGYIVIGRTNLAEKNCQQPIVADMFMAMEHREVAMDRIRRKKSHMKFLMLKSLESMHQRFDTVKFQGPISEYGEKLLDKVAKELGVGYQTC